MTTETSRNATYAPYAQWAAVQAPVPQTTHNLPGTVPASGSVSTSLIRADGYSLIACGLTMTQAGTLSVQRWLDDGGTQPQGAPVIVNVAANTAANLDVLDGRPFAAFTITVTNAAATAATVTGFALLLQASPANPVDSAADGSGSIAAGGTAQTLFGGAVPANGLFVANPDPSNDLWLALFTTAAPNGQGSVRVAANGGYFASEAGMKPGQAISIIGSVTGQKFTAARW